MKQREFSLIYRETNIPTMTDKTNYDLSGVDLIVNAFIRKHLPHRVDLLEPSDNDGEKLRRAIKTYVTIIIKHYRAQYIQQLIQELNGDIEKIG